jgi:mannitol/fructose-specific phosphotransferase system IIA component (Ntr-type)
LPSFNPPEAVTTVAHYTTPTLIVHRLRSLEPAAAISELCATLCQDNRIKEAFPFFNAVISHEMASSTATPEGWALPHARLHGIPRLSFALGRSAAPMKWFGDTVHRVKLVFLVAVPETDGASYLTLISGLAKLSQHPLRVESLLQAPDSKAIFEILHQIHLP